jgi:hypothetical protein
MVHHKELPGTITGVQTFNGLILRYKRGRSDWCITNLGNLVIRLGKIVGRGHCCASKLKNDEDTEGKTFHSYGAGDGAD